MKITKRLTSLILICAFAFTSLCTFTASAAFSDVNETNAYYEAITALVDDGTINGYEDGTFKPDNTITRAEFSKLLAIKTTPSAQTFTQTTTAFPDVAAEHWANAYIAYAASVGAVNGYPDGTFKPENPVTYGEAVKMIICGMGYGTAVDTTLQPWHKGYIELALQIGLTKNAMSLGDNPAPRGIVAQLVYNIASTRVIEQKPNGQWGVSDNPDDTFDNKVDNVQSGKGVLLGVTDYSLDGSTVGRNRVQIDDKIYEIGGNLDIDTIKANYLGQHVEFAYNKSEVTRITKSSGYNSEITIEPWQIYDITSGRIEYNADRDAYYDNEVTKLSFASGMYIIYNSQIINRNDNTFDKVAKFDIDTGSIRFISNDGNDGNAELAIVESYDTYFVGSVTTQNDTTTIVDQNNTAVTVAVDADDAEGKVKKVSSKGGQAADFSLSSIAKKSVVCVAQPHGSSKDGTSVMVSTATVTGEVTEFSDDYETIIIKSQNYEVSPYYEALASDPLHADIKFTQGDSGKFYLDHLGRIVYFEKNVSANPYGLVLAFASSDDMNDSKDWIKILTSTNNAPEYVIKDRVNFDGNTISSTELIAALESSLPLPVQYELSGNTIIGVKSLSEYANSGAGTFTYKKSGYYFADGSSTKFTVKSSGTDATVIYVVPNNENDFSKYEKKTPSNLAEKAYNVVAYEKDGNSSVAKVVICKLAADQTASEGIMPGTAVCFVKSVNTSSKGEYKGKKIAYKNMETGADDEVFVREDSRVYAAASALECGDIIKFLQEDGEMYDLATVYVDGNVADGTIGKLTTDEDGTSASVPDYHIIRHSNAGDNYYQVVLGTISELNDTQMLVIPGFSEGTAKPFNKGSVKYYEYDRQAKDFIASADTFITTLTDATTLGTPEIATKVVILIKNSNIVAVYNLSRFGK